MDPFLTPKIWMPEKRHRTGRRQRRRGLREPRHQPGQCGSATGRSTATPRAAQGASPAPTLAGGSSVSAGARGPQPTRRRGGCARRAAAAASRADRPHRCPND